jgi:ParE toxin of type II toxin-antitoxin system, parDE
MPAAIIGSPPFRARMREIRQFLVEVEAVPVYHQLLVDLEQVVFPNLAAFPLIGQPWLDGKVQSTEALMAMARLPRDAEQRLRQYIHGDFTLLYAVAADAIHLVTIRHHKESTFIP